MRIREDYNKINYIIIILIIILICVSLIFLYQLITAKNVNRIISVDSIFSAEKKESSSNQKVSDTSTTSNKSTTNKEESTETAIQKDDNDFKFGIYLLNDAETKRLLVTESTSIFQSDKVLNTYNVIYTQNSEIEGTRVAECFEKYLKQYTDADKYRVGFNLSFKVGDKTLESNIISPKDAVFFQDYLKINLYDGYHVEKGKPYSSITENTFTKNTILTSIKLTGGKNISKITSDIKLTAFCYDSNDLDKDNNYTGNNKYTITIKQK